LSVVCLYCAADGAEHNFWGQIGNRCHVDSKRIRRLDEAHVNIATVVELGLANHPAGHRIGQRSRESQHIKPIVGRFARVGPGSERICQNLYSHPACANCTGQEVTHRQAITDPHGLAGQGRPGHGDFVTQGGKVDLIAPRRGKAYVYPGRVKLPGIKADDAGGGGRCPVT